MESKAYYSSKEEKERERVVLDFNNAVAQLLQADSKDRRMLFFSLQRMGRQYRIKNFNVAEVLSEAVLRGIKTVEKTGEPIVNLRAWLTRVGFNIIREKSRIEIRNRKLAEKSATYLESADLWDHLIAGDQQKIAGEAIRSLSPEDQELLMLRFVSELSYKEIQDHYWKQKGVGIKIPTLRKKIQRATERLKCAYMTLEQTDSNVFRKSLT